MPEVVLLGPDDQARLQDVLPGVFDLAVREDLVRQFLDDSRHHLSVAVHRGQVVGFASAIHYVHPDKEPELWVNEVGVAEEYRGAGVGKRLIEALLDRAGDLGCRGAWVLTERENAAAMALYESVGGVRRPVDPVMYSLPVEPR